MTHDDNASSDSSLLRWECQLGHKQMGALSDREKDTLKPMPSPPLYLLCNILSFRLGSSSPKIRLLQAVTLTARQLYYYRIVKRERR